MSKRQFCPEGSAWQAGAVELRGIGIVELECRSRECAPPPVGTGGSLPGLPYFGETVRRGSDLGKTMEGIILDEFDAYGGSGSWQVDTWWEEGSMDQIWSTAVYSQASRRWLSRVARSGGTKGDYELLNVIHEKWLNDTGDETEVPVTRNLDREGDDPFAPNPYWKQSSPGRDLPGTGLTSFYGPNSENTRSEVSERGGSSEFGQFGFGLKSDEGYGWYGDVAVEDVLGTFGDMGPGYGEVIVGKPGEVQRLLRGEKLQYRPELEFGGWSEGLEEFGFDPRQPRDERGRWTDAGGGVELHVDWEALSKFKMDHVGSVEGLEKWQAEDLQKEVERLPVAVRMSPGVLDAVSWDGEFLNAHEVDTGKGVYYMDARKRYDQAAGLLELKTIHGYMDVPEDEPVYIEPPVGSGQDEFHRITSDAALSYGGVKVTLRDEVKDRAFFTAGDSLNYGQVPMPVRGKITEQAAGGNTFDDQYVEIQVPGPVTPSDIAEITFGVPGGWEDGVDLEVEGVSPWDPDVARRLRAQGMAGDTVLRDEVRETTLDEYLREWDEA